MIPWARSGQYSRLGNTWVQEPLALTDAARSTQHLTHPAHVDDSAFESVQTRGMGNVAGRPTRQLNVRPRVLACAFLAVMLGTAGCTGHTSRPNDVSISVHADYVGLGIPGVDSLHAVPNAVPAPRTCRAWSLDITSQGGIDLVWHFLVPSARAQATLASVRAIPGVLTASITGANTFESAPTADPGFPPTGAGAAC